jgi:hypothetical protein
MNRPDSQVTVYLKDLAGREIARIFEGSIAADGKRIWFSTTGLPAGIYLVETRSGNYIACRKLVVE